ncbi:TPA: serine--tRNA ligase, partial [Thermoplasmata archaeon]|nr:serine--tRNA ligase [Thermoplasmata archaeon]
MLDARLIREDEGVVRKALSDRRQGTEFLDRFLELDGRWRSLTEEVNGLRKHRNEVAEEIPRLSSDEKSTKIEEMKGISQRVKDIETELRELDTGREECLLNIPNIPDPSVPVGDLDVGDVVTRSGGEPRKFDFKPLPHWEIGERLDIIDFDRGAKVAGTGFYVLKGDGARLERALINFML